MSDCIEEHGWMIERTSDGVPTWWTGGGFSSVPSEGVRFARSDDVLKVIDGNWPPHERLNLGCAHYWRKAGGSGAQQEREAPFEIEVEARRLWAEIPEAQWEAMTSLFSEVPFLGGSWLAIDTIVRGLGEKLAAGWKLVPPAVKHEGREQPLRSHIQDGALQLSIGVDTLKHAVQMNPEYSRPDGESAVTVTDADLFAKGVLDALQEEAEDGTTLAHMMLDKAAEMAIENGTEGVTYDEGEW